MKKITLTCVISTILLLSTAGKTHAQFGLVAGVIKRVIMAIDLRVQRQQTQTILLQDAQKQLENLMQKSRLADISDWVQQQKDLYEEYYQELWQVKNALRYYSAVRNIIEKQRGLIKGYQEAYAVMVKDGHFSGEEIGYIRSVYQGILKKSENAVDRLDAIIKGFVTQMDDGDRLEIINDLAADIDRNYRRLQVFTQNNILLSLQKAKDQQDLNMIKILYGIH